MDAPCWGALWGAQFYCMVVDDNAPSKKSYFDSARHELRVAVEVER